MQESKLLIDSISWSKLELILAVIVYTILDKVNDIIIAYGYYNSEILHKIYDWAKCKYVFNTVGIKQNYPYGSINKDELYKNGELNPIIYLIYEVHRQYGYDVITNPNKSITILASVENQNSAILNGGLISIEDYKDRLHIIVYNRDKGFIYYKLNKRLANKGMKIYKLRTSKFVGCNESLSKYLG